MVADAYAMRSSHSRSPRSPGPTIARPRLHHRQALLLLHPQGRDRQIRSELLATVDLDHSTGSKSLRRMWESGLLTHEPAEHDRLTMRILLTDKGRALRQPLEEMWPALERASVADLDLNTVKQFIATSTVIRREIVERYSSAYTQPVGSSAHTQPVVTDEGGQTHNQKAGVQT